MKLSVTIQDKISSDILVGPISRNQLRQIVMKYSLGNHAFIITNTTVYALYKQWIQRLLGDIPYTVFRLTDSERAKSFSNLQALIGALARVDAPLSRKVFCVCLGGGVVGDVGGLAAALYRRGTPYIEIPTTLLAQIDSSVGGKVAINIHEGKNLAGTFYHPRCILVDPIFLKTLARPQLQEGLAEVVKYGVIADVQLFSLLSRRSSGIFSLEKRILEELIMRCLKIKSRIVSRDEKEKKSLRTVLNFGHTIGHALEAAFSYRGFSHGKAIGLGMVGAGYVSWKMGFCREETLRKIEALLENLGLPCRINLNKKVNRVLRPLFYDKKFTRGAIRMVLPKEIGKARVVDNIKPELVKQALQYICRN